MAGTLGSADNQDGVVGTTGADDKSGVFGRANSAGWGVFGFSERGFAGVFGSSGNNGVFGQTNNRDANGTYGKNDGGGVGAFGQSLNGEGAGVLGRNEGAGWGVHGHAEGTGFAGVFGSGKNNGVFGLTSSSDDAGVMGRNDGGGNGVLGISGSGDGVEGFSDSRNGVFGQSGTGSGLHGYSKSQFGIYARSDAGTAGFFEGSITVTGDVLLQNADCAEEFDVADTAAAEPGSVMVIGPDGRLELCSAVGDRRVAGVVSGAGHYSPALILDQHESSVDRVPVALMGKVFCKVDAAAGAIVPGDLLTTSETAGHAQKLTARDAVGTVVGKALQPHAAGQGLIAILVTLQ